MVGPEQRAERMEALRELLQRLCAPDLTLAEAKPLRGQLGRLLKQIEREEDPGRAQVPAGTRPCCPCPD